MMQTFLTKTSFKKVVLLDYLLEKDNWCAMEELRNLLNVTEKSVLHYIEELEDLFKQYNGNILLKNEDNKRFFIKKEVKSTILCKSSTSSKAQCFAL